MESPFDETDDLSLEACPFCTDQTITSSSRRPSEHVHHHARRSTPGEHLRCGTNERLS